ncbi:MAG: haloacid dehalogenase type II [Terriglobales bacterium]
MALDFKNFSVITFDCYGTLINWEVGILGALQPILKKYGRSLSDAGILELYSTFEPQIQSGPYRPYREVLAEIVRRFGAKLVFTPTQQEIDSLAESIKDWPPFGDTSAGLRKLKTKYKLAIISNIDDDLLAYSLRLIGVPFDFLITAQQAKSYKPSHNNFNLALKKIGLPKEKVLHAAESLYHDVAPANELGIANVWVNRRGGKPGATKDVAARPNLEVPDIKTLAEVATK